MLLVKVQVGFCQVGYCVYHVMPVNVSDCDAMVYML